MTYQLPNPQSKRWSQTNSSDRFGSLWVTRNMDFDRDGYATLAKRARSLYDTSVDADFTEVIGFAFDQQNNRYYILTEGHVFYINAVLQSVTDDNAANVPTTINARSDIQVFYGRIYVSAGTADDLRHWDGSVWTTSVYALSSNTAPMAVFENKVMLAIGQSNEVWLLASDHTLQQTLVLPADYTVTSLDWADNRMWIGTRHRYDGEALLFEWDGNSSSANNGYPVGSNRIECVKRYKGTVVVFNGEGQLLQYVGGGFRQLGALPVYYTNYKYSRPGNSITGKTSHRGIAVQGDLIFVNVLSVLQTPSDDELAPKHFNWQPGGIWCYDPNVGFYHRHSISGDRRLQSNAVTTANVNTTTEVITIGGVTVPETGTPVFYDDGSNGTGTAIGGLVHRKKYFVIKASDTTMKLATTAALASAGTAIDLTGTGNNAQFFVFAPNRDFGGTMTGTGGGIVVVQSDDPITSDGGSLLFGGTIPQSAAATAYNVLNTVATGQENRGSMASVRLDATGIKDGFQKLTIKFKGIKTAEDKILVKWRIAERDDKLKFLDTARTLTGTFTSGTTFTSTATELANAKVGDEVEFHYGSGQGYTAHITAISYSAPTYTITIDETITNLAGSDTCLFTIDNWQKEATITTSDIETYTLPGGATYSKTGGSKTFDISNQAEWLQFKLELRGEDVTIEDVLINNRPMREYVA